ncbi:endonuclease/exonuclease/phosphatase family protein [Aromatoleum toluolicum]|uniref:Endonuclease/exonuclease/phosphatase domain-containing protein n=1 Tax=Aromatoleum toluolicum TaxID=90060 RepID=A0ABX1NLT2_9RHOO|nr:endonuclease/exonuclease/phosphatase family protein [Aromatoleum toluolicum]NMG00307.1 endonuclease/exonuclease/phosphatase family protein [Aromatoleum toluolicum]
MAPLIAAITRRAKALLLLSAAGASLPLFADQQHRLPSTLAWVLDLAAHWQWVYLTIGAICATWLLMFRAYGWALPCMAVLAGGWISASPEPHAIASPVSQPLTVVTANLHAENRDVSALRRWVESLDADIVIVQEVTPSTMKQLEQWEHFPHRLIQARTDPFGLAVLSRHAITESEARAPADQTLHYRALVRWGERRVALGAVHPMPPVSAEYHALRDALFESEARWVAATGLPAVLAGDFNATPWSSAMRPFRAHGLRRATDLTPTWPAHFPLIPIDQIVVTPHWRVLAAGVGPQFGSDHRPAYTVLAPAAP